MNAVAYMKAHTEFYALVREAIEKALASGMDDDEIAAALDQVSEIVRDKGATDE